MVVSFCDNVLKITFIDMDRSTQFCRQLSPLSHTEDRVFSSVCISEVEKQSVRMTAVSLRLFADRLSPVRSQNGECAAATSGELTMHGNHRQPHTVFVAVRRMLP